MRGSPRLPLNGGLIVADIQAQVVMFWVDCEGYPLQGWTGFCTERRVRDLGMV